MKRFILHFHFHNRLACGAVGIMSILQSNTNKKCCEPIVNKPPDNLPIYTINDVSKRNSVANRIWVIYGEYVYDITDWIPNHPGGQEKIMLAAGSRLEPYWQLYQQHYNSKLPLQVLETMRVGRLAPSESINASDNVKLDDPYKNDPETSGVLIYHQRKPINAEPPKSILSDQYLTPNNLWFIRNHHPVPAIDEQSYKFELNFDGFQKTLSLDDLKSRFPKHYVTSSIQCGGNRRKDMNNISLTNGSPWDVGAISTATWAGAKLSDVLKSLGLNVEIIERNKYKHVQFYSVDGVEVSIPLKKALDEDGDTLLAYEMNGDIIPRVHGYPVRVIIPGYVGVRNLKWLSKIVLSGEEASGPWQRGMAYKGFSPSVKSLEGIDTSKIASLQEQPVQSAIFLPESGSKLHSGMSNLIKGYAYSGGGRGIIRVDVSIDGGKSWNTATLTEGSDQPLDKAWAWTFWELDISIPESMASSEIEIICKAVDSSHNVQPDSVNGIWNLRGINNNSWHRVKTIVD